MTWKRYAGLFLALCLALSLTACQDEKRVEGVVVEVQTNASGDITAFVVEDDGERTGVLMADKTTIWPRGSGSWSGEEIKAAFRSDLQTDAWAFARCYSRREKLIAADGEEVRAYWAISAGVSGELKREAVTLRDGTAVDVLEEDGWSSRTYRLTDGTELLRVNELSGPENHYVMGLEGFEGLSETAKEKVRRYYEDRGLLYDEAEELEKCYAAWRKLGEKYRSGHISQDVTPRASSERVMYFTTELLLPQEYGTPLCSSTSLQDAFDRRTGEKLGAWDLFAVPEAEVRAQLPELVDWEIDPALRAEMSAALEPEWIRFDTGGLYVEFPAGSLPGEELDYIVSVDSENIPEGFIRPWALPESWGEETP